MAIASGGTLGAGGTGATTGTSFSFLTVTNTLSPGDLGILVVVSENVSATDGNTNTHTSVGVTGGIFSKLYEHTNANGAAGAGTTTSVWRCDATAIISPGSTVTVNHANLQDRCSIFWKFTVGANKTLYQTTQAVQVQNDTDAAQGFGSASFSGLTSASRLYIRGLGKEANSITALTVSSGFTEIPGARSRNAAAAMLVRAEFRINTSTGETSNPTMAVTGDTAGIFFALEEVDLVSATMTPGTGELVLTFGSRSTKAGVLTLASFAPTVQAAGSSIQTVTAGITISGVPPPSLSFKVVLPAATALTLSGTAPLFPVPGDTKTGALSLTGQAPSIQTSAGANVTVTPNQGVLRLQRIVEQTPGTAQLILTGRIPLAGNPFIPQTGQLFFGLASELAGKVGSLTLTGAAPVLQVPVTTSTAAPLVLTGATITVARGLILTVGSLTLTGSAGSAVRSTLIQPSTGGLTTTGIAGATAMSVPPATGSLALTGVVPLVQTSTAANTNRTPSTQALLLTGQQPSVSSVNDSRITTQTGSAAFTGVAGSTSRGTALAPTTGAEVLNGQTPTLRAPVVPGTGSLAIDSAAGPSFRYDFRMVPPTGQLAATGAAPPLFREFFITGTVGTLTVTGIAGRNNRSVIVASGALALVSGVPGVELGTTTNTNRSPNVGGLALTGQAPTVQTTVTNFSIVTGNVELHMTPPLNATVYQSNVRAPARTSLVLTPQLAVNASAFEVIRLTHDRMLIPTLDSGTSIVPTLTEGTLAIPDLVDEEVSLV